MPNLSRCPDHSLKFVAASGRDLRRNLAPIRFLSGATRRLGWRWIPSAVVDTSSGASRIGLMGNLTLRMMHCCASRERQLGVQHPSFCILRQKDSARVATSHRRSDVAASRLQCRRRSESRQYGQTSSLWPGGHISGDATQTEVLEHAGFLDARIVVIVRRTTTQRDT